MANALQADGLRLSLLGEVRLSQGAQPLRFARRKCASLLAYLALHPGPQPREQLAQALWPQVSAEAARGSLRVTLTELRKLLGAHALDASDSSTLGLHPAALTGGIDLLHLRALIDQGDRATAAELQSGLDLVQGELAASLDEPWIEQHRVRLTADLKRLLHRLVAHHREAAQYPAAVRLAQRALQIDPTDETVHQHLMACLWAQGNHDAALHQYTLCEQALAQQLGQLPSAETQALAAGLKRQFARASSARLSNLPSPATRFVGREDELNQIEELLTQTRLLTLFGPGGSGKTRLAIQAAAEVAFAFEGGVWWVDLSTLDDGQRVPKALAAVLGVKEQGDAPLLMLVLRQINAQRLLLVLDNCEQVLQACAGLVEQALAQCPGLTVLATSRQALDLDAETVWTTPALALPEASTGSASTELPALLNADALRLFAERAQQADAAFELNVDNAPQVLEICRRLQGIPLAIELAAAQLSSCSVAQLVARLDEALDFTAPGQRLERHATLRNAIRWSCRALGPAEQVLFRRLAVFAGGFALDAAAAVVAGTTHANTAWLPSEALVAGLPPLPVDSRSLTAQLLDSLVRQALVQVRRSERGLRYVMLDSLREDARLQCQAAGDWEAVQDRHFEHALALAQRVEPMLDGADQVSYAAQLERENANLEAALDWAERQPSVERALQLAVILCPWWKRGSHFSWTLQRLRRLLQRAQQESPAAGPPLTLHGQAFYWLADCASRINLFDEAQAAALRSQQIHEALGDRSGQARAAAALSMSASMSGDYVTAHQAGMRSLALCRELNDLPGLTVATNRMAELTRVQGLLDQSVQLNRDCLALAESTGDHRGVSVAQLNLGLLAVAQGRPVEGAQLLHQAGEGLWALGVRNHWAYIFQGVGQACLAVERLADGARLFGALQAYSQGTGYELVGTDLQAHQQEVAALLGSGASADVRAAWSAGLALDADSALALLRGTAVVAPL